MSFKTLSSLVLDVHAKLRLVPGTAVQVYNEDYTAQLLRETYYSLAREPEFWWPQFMSWSTITPDGTTGKPTTSFNTTDVPWKVRHEDIRCVIPVSDHRPLAVFPRTANPTFVTYTRPYVDFINDPYKLFRILPVTTTESFSVHVRQIEPIVVADDLLLFDDIVLVNRVAWMIATNNGNNPSNGMVFLSDFEAALNRVKLTYSDMPSELDHTSGEYPTNWYEHP